MQLINIIINAIYNNNYLHTAIKLNNLLFVMIAIKLVTRVPTNYQQVAHLVIQGFIYGKELVNHFVQKEPISMQNSV